MTCTTVIWFQRSFTVIFATVCTVDELQPDAVPAPPAEMSTAELPAAEAVVPAPSVNPPTYRRRQGKLTAEQRARKDEIDRYLAGIAIWANCMGDWSEALQERAQSIVDRYEDVPFNEHTYGAEHDPE